VGIRLGHSFEELVEGLFPFRFKLPNITGHHRRHRYPINTLSYPFKPEVDGNVKNQIRPQLALLIRKHLPFINLDFIVFHDDEVFPCKLIFLFI